jgi:putative addiction module component (TIGR02574 family)
MAKTANEVIHDALELSEEDRGRVMSALADSLADADPSFLAELDRRIASADSGEDEGVSWEEVRAEVVETLATGRKSA